MASSSQPHLGPGMEAPEADSDANGFFQEKRTCLSTFPHYGKDIKDHLSHYFGCIEFRDRETYFENKNVWLSSDNNLEKKCNTAMAIFAQLKRTCVLRKAINAEKLPRSTRTNAFHALIPNPELSNEETKETSLVEDVDKSLEEWKNTDVFKKGRDLVRHWRDTRLRAAAQDGNITRATSMSHDGESPSHQAMREKLNDLKEKIRQLDRTNSNADVDSMEISEYDLERDINAYIMRFCMEEKKGEEETCFGLKGCDFETSSNDKVPDIKESTDVRYIHIPSNNMHWVEKLIEWYYGQENRDGNSEEDDSWMSHKDMLLRSQFWKGQQHGGGGDSIQARHMRPLCERVSSDHDVAEEMSKNVVLFMPYLHWETDRRREIVARLIEDKVQKFHEDQKEKQTKEEEYRIADRKGLPVQYPKDEYAKETTGSNPLRDVATVVLRFLSEFRRKDEKQETEEKPVMSKPRRSELGQFLLDAARLHEAMSSYRDRKMIEKFLFHEAPLHPRRTLDQSHFWTLNSTRARDRDQVVYRGTSMEADKVHRLVQKKKSKCHSWLPGCLSAAKDSSSEDQYYWTCQENLEARYYDSQTQTRQGGQSAGRGTGMGTLGNAGASNEQLKGYHVASGTTTSTTQSTGEIVPSGGTQQPTQPAREEEKDQEKQYYRCPECLENIRKVPRLIMVDQLWMWILDENTIITSFPRRYGVNKRDESGVYKSIRIRLKGARKYQFRSVYDIALVIIDECSNTFFDRTKINGELPQVMDIFSRAIGNATCKQTMSFGHVWHWTKEAYAMYRSQLQMVDVNLVHDNLLDINPEGKIQREIKDIIEELDIMLLLQSKQVETIKRLVRNVLSIMHPDPDSSVLQEVGDELRNRRLPIKEGMSRDVRKKVRKYNRFLESANELQADMADRIQEIQNLKTYADSTARGITDLMALKQQQASVAQAWQAVQQADETVKQGRAIMVFTLITIVFLPLSFMSSIFGMNNAEFGSNGWALEQQLKLMFSISIGFTAFVTIFAYSSFTRTLLWSTGKVGYTLVIIWLHIYHVWVSIQDKWSAPNLSQRATNKVKRLHEEVRRSRHEKLNGKRLHRRERPNRNENSNDSIV